MTFESLMWATANKISFFANEEFGGDSIYLQAPDLFDSQIDFYITTSSLI